jgi:hypothetical protein
MDFDPNSLPSRNISLDRFVELYGKIVRRYSVYISRASHQTSGTEAAAL